MDLGLFINNVKYRCEQKGVKPTVACRESGAGERLLENVKRGSVPSVEKAQLLAQYLGVTVSDLLGETPRTKPSFELPPDIPEEVMLRSPPLIRLTVAEVDMIEAYRAADQRAKDIVDLALAPFMAKEKARNSAG